jgi:hypothetical protein
VPLLVVKGQSGAMHVVTNRRRHGEREYASTLVRRSVREAKRGSTSPSTPASASSSSRRNRSLGVNPRHRGVPPSLDWSGQAGATPSAFPRRPGATERATLRLLERYKQRFLPEDLELSFDDIVDSSERTWDLSTTARKSSRDSSRRTSR